jgi:HEAT repeat protein
MLDEPRFIKPLREALKEDNQDWPAWRFAQALGTLAHIARDEEDKTDLREFLAGYVNHRNRYFQAGAIRALGTLGDPRAIPIIRTFARDEPRNSAERAAKTALEKLQEQKRLVPEEVIELRKVVDELKKDGESLKKEVEDLKRRLDAKEAKEPANDDE